MSQLLAILACAVFSAGLLSYALIGTTARYLQDDFCYAYILRGDDFLRQQVNSYLYQTTYSANRFSLTLGMGLTGLAGQGVVPVLPGLMLAAWVLGLYALLRRLSSLHPLLSLTRLEAVILAEALALFTLSMAPNWIQIFFWRPGMLPYFAPLVTGTYLMVLLLAADQAVKRRMARSAISALLAGIFLLALLTGGFSETAVCVEVAASAILLGVTVVRHRARRMAQSAIRVLPAGMALLGSLAAMAILIASPANAGRLSLNYGAAASLQSTLVNSLNGAVYFYLATAYRPTLLYASVLVFFGLFGLAQSLRSETPPLSAKTLAAGFAAACLIAYALTVAALAPSFYAESSYPGDRALLIPRFVSILLAAVTGWLGGNALSRWANGRRAVVLAMGAGAVILLIDGLWLSEMTGYFYPPAYPEMRAFLKLHLAPVLLLAVVGAILFGLVAFRYKTQAALALLVAVYLLQPGLMGARMLREYPILRKRAALWDARQAQILAARDRGERELTVRALDSLAGLTDLSSDPGYWVNTCTATYYGLTSIRAVEPVLDKQLENP